MTPLDGLFVLTMTGFICVILGLGWINDTLRRIEGILRDSPETER